MVHQINASNKMKKKKLRILAFSDLHSDEKALRSLEKKAKNADILVCAGDFTYFELGMKRILRKLNSFGKKVVLVHGNHEEPFNVRLMSRNMKNIIYVHKKLHRHGNYVFVGHGGEGFSLTSKDFETFAAKLRFKKDDKVILVNHQPPHKTRLDFIWAHHGNRSYRNFILRKKPILAICGHLHETAGKKDRLGRTTLLNAGEKGVIVEV